MLWGEVYHTMRKKLAAILASSLYLFPIPAQSKRDTPEKLTIECQKRKGNLSQLEKELTGYGYKLYSHSAPPNEAKIIMVGYNTLKPDPRMAAVLASYIQDNDTMLIEGQQKGKPIDVKSAKIPALRCLQGRNIKAYGATHNVGWYNDFIETLEAYGPPDEMQRTALNIVIYARIQGSRRKQEEEYAKLMQEYAKKPQGRVYAVIDYEYVTNGRFTLNLKRNGIAFAAVSPPHKKLEQAVAERVKDVTLTVSTENGEVALPYHNFTVRGAPLTLFEAIVIAKGNVEYSGDEKIKYLSDRRKEVSLPRGKKYSVKRKEIIDKE